jgi:hypothetical protein
LLPIKRTAYAVVLLVLCAGTAAAQERDRDRTFAAARAIAEELRRARLHWGSMYLMSSIQFGEVGVDQQFFVPTTDTGHGLSFSVSAPTRLYYVPRKKTIFSFEYTPQYTRFHRGASKNVLGYQARGDAQFILNHLFLDAYATKSSLLRADTAEIARMVDVTQSSVGLTGELRYSTRTSLHFSAANARTDYPRTSLQPDPFTNTLELLNRSEHNYRASARHRTFPLTSLIVAGEWSNYSFDRAAYKNATRTYAGAGFDYEGGITDLKGEAGLSHLDFKRGTERDFRGTVGSLNYSRRNGRNWRTSANALRDAQFSLFLGNDYFIADRVGAAMEYELTRHITLDANATLGQDRYDTPVFNPTTSHADLRVDKISWISTGFTYGRRRFRGGLDVGYVTRTSNFHFDEQNGIRLVVRLSITP